MEKSVVVMLDDVLNTFTDTLHKMGVSYNPKRQSISDRSFLSVFYTREGQLTPVAQKAMGKTPPRPDGLAFLRWLKEGGWTVILCTNRDIRLAYDVTKRWLDAHGAEYDYLFTATTPAGLCIDMESSFLVYNLPDDSGDHLNVVTFAPSPFGVKEPVVLGDFQTFEEVKQCIQNTSC